MRAWIGANAPIGIGRGNAFLIVRRRIEIVQRKHRASAADLYSIR
jgi:hypothetical protein